MIRNNQLDQADINQMQNARDFVTEDIERRFPEAVNIVHANHRGLNYHFYGPRNIPRPSHLTVDLAVRAVRMELEPFDHHDQAFHFRRPDGGLAASVTILEVDIELENFARTTRVYCTWLYMGQLNPQFANIMVVLA